MFQEYKNRNYTQSLKLVFIMLLILFNYQSCVTTYNSQSIKEIPPIEETALYKAYIEKYGLCELNKHSDSLVILTWDFEGNTKDVWLSFDIRKNIWYISSVSGQKYFDKDTIFIPLLENVIKTEHYDDIENPYSDYSIQIEQSYTDEIRVGIISSNNGKKLYYLSVSYIGEDWRFMDGIIKIRINELLITKKDNKPYTDVFSGGRVYEHICVYFTKEEFIKLLKANTLKLQYWIRPVNVIPDGIINLKTFSEISILK